MRARVSSQAVLSTGLRFSNPDSSRNRVCIVPFHFAISQYGSRCIYPTDATHLNCHVVCIVRVCISLPDQLHLLYHTVLDTRFVSLRVFCKITVVIAQVFDVTALYVYALFCVLASSTAAFHIELRSIACEYATCFDILDLVFFARCIFINCTELHVLKH